MLKGVKEEKFNVFLKKHSAKPFFACETINCSLYANGVLGIPKHHDFGKRLLENLPDYFDAHHNEPNYIRTGPHYLTYVAKKYPNDCTILPMRVFYPIYWTYLKDPWKHTKLDYHPDSLLFQYGYSTNNFHKIFQLRNTVTLFLVCTISIVLLEVAQRYQISAVYPYALFLPFAIFIKYNYIH